jgi:hypothetical protein
LDYPIVEKWRVEVVPIWKIVDVEGVEVDWNEVSRGE